VDRLEAARVNPRAAIVMAAVALAAGCVAFFLYLRVPHPDDQRKFDREIFHYSVSKIDRITVKVQREVLYELERQGDKWIYKHPPLGDADAGRILRAIADLRFEARVKDEFTGPGPLDRFGLVKPKLEVSLHEPGATYAFELGDSNATKDGVYIRVMPGARVLLTLPVVATLFPSDAASFAQASQDGGAAGPRKG
jgi:hypothetical protein